MKKALLLLALLLLVPTTANCNTADQIIQQQMSASGADSLSESLQGIAPDTFDFGSVARTLAKGEWQWSFNGIINGLLNTFSLSFRECVSFMLQLVALALLGAVAGNLQYSFEEHGVANAAFLGSYLMVAVVAVKAFMTASAIGEQAVENMVAFMNALVPVTLSLVAMSGAPVSSGVFHPVLLAGVQGVAMVVRSAVFPLIMLSTACSCANHITNGYKLSKVASLLKNTARWLLGVTMTVFVGVVTLQGAVMPSVDNVTVKTAKFTVSNLIPGVGRVLSDSLGMVFSCGKLMKNAVGVAGLIGVFLICFLPAVKVLAHSFAFHVAGALVDTVSDKRISSLISDLGSSLTMVFTVVLTVCMMFVMNLTIIICTTNIMGVGA